MDIENFIAEFKKTFVYDILSQTLSDEQLFEHVVDGDVVLWFKEQTRQMWLMWEKAQAVPEWISMEDKYPKAGESVLICINGIRQNIAYFYDYSASDEYSTGHDWFEPVFTGGETEDECVVKTEDVTHWMLLPQEPAND